MVVDPDIVQEDTSVTTSRKKAFMAAVKGADLNIFCLTRFLIDAA